ncbi:MAG: ankyrin repeat domain-containing protein [Stagnimonas sp.]|nr:ankyrin repeat domain-containing protein [Stagnimonas sp.]
MIVGCSSELGRKLVTASGDGDVMQVEALLQQGANVNLRLPDTGTTPLIAAARRGHISVMQVLLDRGAEINAVDDGVGTALYWAVFEGQVEAAKFLLEKRARLNCQRASAEYLLRHIRTKGSSEVEALVRQQLALEEQS